MKSMKSVLTRRRFGVAACLLVGAGLLASFAALNRECPGGLLPRATCLYLQTPLVWLAPESVLPTPAPEILASLPVPPGMDPNDIQHTPPTLVDFAADTSLGAVRGLVNLQSTWAERIRADGTI